jgi:type II secretory pathway predicted ATPase ExeA
MPAVKRIMTIEPDPFSDTTSPGAYVPRTATESALVQMEMALRDGARLVCLEGPPGCGKSILLNVLEERFTDDFRALRVPYPKLDPDEFCHWGLAALRGSPVDDPERALAERIATGAASGDPPLVWIVDDADCLPVPTLHSLLSVQRNTGNALRLLLARSGELPDEELAQAGVRPVNVHLDGEMEREEMAQYVRARLDGARADSATRMRIETAIDELYSRSGGNPRRLHAAASVLLCFGRERFEAIPEPQRAAAPLDLNSPAHLGLVAALVRSELVRAIEVPASPNPEAERVSIESLVAEAVAAEQPIEEIASAESAPFESASAEPVPAQAQIAPEPPSPSEGDAPQGVPPRPARRKRHRLRRLGRR